MATTNKNFVVIQHQNLFDIHLRNGFLMCKVILPPDNNFMQNSACIEDLCRSLEKRLKGRY